MPLIDVSFYELSYFILSALSLVYNCISYNKIILYNKCLHVSFIILYIITLYNRRKRDSGRREKIERDDMYIGWKHAYQEDANGRVDGKIGDGESIAGDVLAILEIRVQHLARSLHGFYVFFFQRMRPEKYYRVLCTSKSNQILMLSKR